MGRTRDISILLMGVLFSALLILIPSVSPAQYFHIQTYREHDGVSSNNVYNAAQDSLGNIWFGTHNGLSRYDGVRWQKIHSRDSGSPRGPGLVSIDENGGIWWVSKDGFTQYSYFINGHWNETKAAFSTRGNRGILGVESWINSQGIPNLIIFTTTDKILHWNGHAWLPLESRNSTNSIFSMNRNGSQILLSTASGLEIFDLSINMVVSNPVEGLPPGPVFATASNPQTGATWVVGNQWVAKISSTNNVEVLPVPEMDMTQIESPTSATIGPDGYLYFLDYGRIFSYHPKLGFKALGSMNGLASNAANYSMIDRENNIWLTSLRGISKIISRKLATYDNSHGLLDNEVSAICERASGTIVLGHQTGLTIMGPKPRKISFNHTNGRFSRVIDLSEDPEGTLWIAADRQGLGFLNENDSVQWLDTKGQIQGAVYSILHHPEQGMFVGTSTGLYRKNGGRFEQIILPGMENEANNFIRRIIMLNNNDFALATGYHGIFIWHAGQFKQFNGDSQQGSQSTYSVFQHEDGKIWVGTAVGLFEVINNQLERTASPGPEISRPIFSIARDHTGKFWFGTDEGVTTWNGQIQTRLTAKDGLIGNETNRDALLVSQDGSILIGTDGGLSVYRQELESPSRLSPVLHLSGLVINGKANPVDEPIKIIGPLSSLTYLFRAPTFSNDNRIQFIAKDILNLDNQAPIRIHWPGVLPLTNLPSGKYQFQIYGITSDSRQTNTITTPLITVVPTFQNRWFTQLGIWALRLAAVWAVFAYLMGKKYSRRLEKEVLQQTAEFRQSEENAQLESERLKGTLSSISDGVVVIDGQSTVVVINTAATAMFGHTTQPKLGCKLVDILPIDSLLAPLQKKRYQHLLDNPEGIHLESEQVPIRVSECDTRWYEISAVPIHGSPGGLVFAFRDITNRRRLDFEERRAQKLESLGVLAGGIAHDFNNLLTIMMGNLSLMQSTLVTTPEEDIQLEKTLQATDRARNLTRQLLTFAKGGAPHQQPTNLAHIIRDSASFNLSGSNVECSVDIPNDLWWSNVDGDQIAQIVGNLVLNAAQAMPHGGSLAIVAENQQQAGLQLVSIVFKDQGTGISSEDQNRIFDPYFSTKAQGSGLGLAIANSIAEKHGGQLSVQSQLGEGSTFTLTLPACETSNPHNKLTEPRTRTAPGSSLKILFMDDEQSIRQLVKSMLQNLGHHCICVEHGQEAQKVFSQNQNTNAPFDLTILDLTIPGGLGGLDTLSQLRILDINVKVIVTSGYSDDPVMANFKKFGFSGILKKPFNIHDLEQAISFLPKDNNETTN